ncbi:MAG: 4Fe-4S dicluster domain-containing protein [Deltaproteobacteria bacterium]|nr:4Fe-4S dicluster domain-containing protein [Deltaproteobacteria bacterium]
MKVEDKLALNKFDVDRDVHITVNDVVCVECELKPCVSVCPAECYVIRENHMTFSYEGCLECGSCRIACPKGAIDWVYPRGGFGICYQYG